MTYVVALSLVLQLMAAALAMRLARRTERRVAWTLITAALVLMVFRRALPLYRVLAGDPSVALDPYQESIGLALSFFMVVGIATIAPLFTAVRRAEGAFRESEERFRLLSEAAFEAIALHEKGVILDGNGAFARMFGYDLAELIGKNVLDLAAPQSRELVLKHVRSGREAPYEAEGLRKDGSTFWAELSGTSVPYHGKMVRVTTLRDITERKKAEDARALNSQRVQALLQLNQMAAATLQEITDFALEEAVRLTQSKIGYLAFLNEDESVLTMHSWSKSAMAECAVAEKPIVYPVLSTGLWGEAVRQRRPVVTNDYAAADPRKKGYPQGHVALTRHMNAPVFDGSRIVIVAGVGNKTEEYDQGDIQQLTLLMAGMWRLIERKRADEALRENELKYRALFETAEGAVLLFTDGRWVDCNAGAPSIFGCTREQIIGAHPSRFSPPMQPDGRSSEEEAIKKINLAFTTGPQFFEWEHCRADGTPFSAEVSLNRLDLGGKPHMQAIVRDITERKQAEEKIRSINVELEVRVSERTAELESTNRQLSAENAARQHAEQALLARNEDLKGFAYTVSHDLKAPLRGISGYSAELDRKHRAGLDERAQFCIAQILTATRNLDRLIEDLLHYSRLDAETPSLTRVNLLSLVEAILQDHSLMIAEQRAEVAVDVPPITLETWERGLVQVLTNLIDNALKYSRKALPPRLTIAAEELPGTCRLTVADNGIGFDMKYHDRIFGLFNRLVRADEFEGTGAGLAIVKKLTEKLGGTIHAESALGQGATFFVELPNDPTRRTVP
jgi:PAS domain S-box-containing protein